MGDPEAEADAIGGAQDQTTQPDPAQQLDSDAWFAEFLSENAEKLEQHNQEAINENDAAIAAASARHDKDLEIAQRSHEFAALARDNAGDYAKEAAANPYRRAEFEDDAQQALQRAAKEDELAAKAEADAAEAQTEAKRLEEENTELRPIRSGHEVEASIRHDQAQALERAAADERESQALNRPAEGAGQE